jgi:hypothetical protein
MGIVELEQFKDIFKTTGAGAKKVYICGEVELAGQMEQSAMNAARELNPFDARMLKVAFDIGFASSIGFSKSKSACAPIPDQAKRSIEIMAKLKQSFADAKRKP